MIEDGAVPHSLVGFRYIKVPDAFAVGIPDHRDGVIADHAFGLIGRKLPDGKAAALLELTDKSVDEIRRTLLIDQRKQGMLGAVGIPEREYRIVIELAFRAVDMVVPAAVAVVDIRIDIRGAHAVIQGAVEDRALI